MKLLQSWLKKHVPDFGITDLSAFKHRMDTRLSEVESVLPKGEGLSSLVIAEVLEVEAHPGNSKLHVCKVNTGNGVSTIVCGADNVKVGLRTIACLPGGSVYKPGTSETMPINSRKMGEVTSEGMLCAPDEIGIGTSHAGIIELDSSLPVGTPVVPLLQDVVIEIENKALPHRGDTFSHLGIAREISAIFKTRVQLPETTLTHKRADDDLPIKVSIQANDLCARYSGVVISGLKVGPSPLWLQVALAYAGIKSINNVVDITNYIMLDIGQPLHAFDASKIEGGEIIVRQSKKGEELVTIDHQKRILPEGILVIADRQKILGIAGVMGGEQSEVSENTTTIFLESANFEMYSIRRASRLIGMRSEAVTRFEKGITPEITLEGLKRAANMILDVCDAEIASEVVDEYQNPQAAKTIRFDLNSVKRTLGIDLDKKRILDILSSLGIEALGAERIAADALNRSEVVTEVELLIPPHRRDLNANEDILEEVGRLYGYEHITPTLPKRDLTAPAINKANVITLKAKHVLAASGLQEVYTYSMVGEALFSNVMLDTDNMLEIMNPISPELAMVRDHLLPSLLEKIPYNLIKYPEFGLFEAGKVAIKKKGAEGLPTQFWQLVGVRTAADDRSAYQQLKFALESLSQLLFNSELKVSSNKPSDSFWHPGKSGSIVLGKQVVGSIGVLHPQVLLNLEISQPVAAMVLDWENLLDYAHPEGRIKPVSAFQPVGRDISFWQKPNTYVGEVLDAIQEARVNLVDSVTISDLFTKDDRTSITLSVVLQSLDHTLSQVEITQALDAVTKIVSKQGHEVR